MAYQTQRLVMVGLGVEHHVSNHAEPRLADGIHLRWQPSTVAGLPSHGYHLYRREHKPPRPRCLAPSLKGFGTGSLGTATLTTSIGVLSSDANLVLTDQFAMAGVPEVDLDGRTFTDLTLLPQYLAYRTDVTIGMRSADPIEVTAYLGTQALEIRQLQAPVGTSLTISLRLDAIDRMRFHGGAAALIDVCVYAAATSLSSGWEPVKSFPAPMCLPVSDAGYPCASAPQSPQDAFQMARDRIQYDDPPTLDLTRFNELHAAMQALVAGGMTQPLEDLFLAAIHPQTAQMLGLYWHDGGADRDVVYDYMILADHDGPSTRPSEEVLADALADQFQQYDAWVVTAIAWPGSPEVAAPENLSAIVLDGERAGLRWDVMLSPPATRGIAFHVWRAARDQHTATVRSG